MKNPNTGYTYRMPHSVLLSEEENERIVVVAARITKANKGRRMSKSGLMREVTLRFMKDYEREQVNGKEKKK